MKKTAIFPGSFDPLTYGHLDLIKRALHIFDEVLVAVAANTQKKTLFSSRERVEMLREATECIEGIRVEAFDGLVIEHARQNNINVLIRGLRMISDFEYELQMALTNRRLDEEIETIFLMPSERHAFVSSSLIKEASSFGADVSSFVPEFVARKLKERLSGVNLAAIS